MTMFAQAVGWQNFADSMSVEMEVREAELTNAMETLEAKVMLDAWLSMPPIIGPRGGVKVEFNTTMARASRDTNPEIVDLRDRVLKAKAARKRSQVVRDNSERIAQLLSRELSRRIGRDPTERRSARYQP